MKYYRHNWYNVGGVIFAALSFVIGYWRTDFSLVQVVFIYSFMALLVHQFEEYAYPGGFPAIFNADVFGEREVPDRYPLNANQCLITNVFLAYPFYLAAICWPRVIWLGSAVVLFGMLQFIVHGLVINVRRKSFYNPGLATVMFLFLPIGVYYFWYVTASKLATTGDIIAGSALAIVAGFITVALPLWLLADRDSKYPFTDAEMRRKTPRQT
ncbi:MAG TPA: HXXEE domain-containing protein [Gemmatimonadales bacterium]|jgi:hypothetical protein